MTKEDLKKNIEDMEIYVPIATMERYLEMPKTTIQQVLNGHRNLPKKWVKVLERYFNEKIYKISESDKWVNPQKDRSYIPKVGDKVNLPQEAMIAKVEKKDEATKVSFAEKRITKLVENSTTKDEIPRLKGESYIDYQCRCIELKEKVAKILPNKL
jgi:hypothetical protein